ncbi:MAG: HupE/UreJ family protein [Thermodesulfobacteriota bacterium]
MKLIRFTALPALSAIIFFLPVSAYAHTGLGHGSGFLSGFIHPVGGFDHLLAMVAVGIWASQNRGKAIWALPAAFVGVMLLGAILGMIGLSLPFIEGGVISSVLILGVLIAAATRMPLATGLIITGIFAMFHGHAHGTEMPLSASGAAYGAGFAAATLLLHLGGIITAVLAEKTAGTRLIRYSGAVIAVAGVYLFFA